VCIYIYIYMHLCQFIHIVIVLFLVLKRAYSSKTFIVLMLVALDEQSFD